MSEFSEPVQILVEPGFPVKIRSAIGALVILGDWRKHRGPAHAAAEVACRGVLLGDTTAEDARAAFIEFGASANILLKNGSVDHAGGSRVASSPRAI